MLGEQYLDRGIVTTEINLGDNPQATQLCFGNLLISFHLVAARKDTISYEGLFLVFVAAQKDTISYEGLFLVFYVNIGYARSILVKSYTFSNTSNLCFNCSCFQLLAETHDCRLAQDLSSV